MMVNNEHYRTVWMEDGIVKMIDQSLLPHQFRIIDLKTTDEVADAIRTMKVRGAPAIGATGAYGIAQAALQAPETGFHDFIQQAADTLEETRPTAHDLFHGIDRILAAIKTGNPEEARKLGVEEAEKYANESVEACRRIGEFGAELIKDGFKILTHCNAGWLATVDWGTALSPIYTAKKQGKDIFVYIDETRPRLQGAKLTAWELLNEGIPHAVIADNAAGYFMKKGEIDMVIVGADRTAGLTGGVANKIGTYEKAVCAKENNTPFYVASPTSTIDFKLKPGDQITIEERSEDEVLFISGKGDSGKIVKARVAPEGSKARNPAFDITPPKYITGIITEKGILKPNELMKLSPK